MSFVAAAIGVVGAVAGGAIAASGAEGAAQTQAAAAQRGQDISQGIFDKTSANEAPFLNAGIGAQSNLNYLLGIGKPGDPALAGASAGTAASSPAGGFGSFLTPFNADNFKSLTPQYQFNLQQGGQGVLNQDASAQGAESGAALKDLIGFNQGYANNSFNSAFANYNTQQNNIFGRLNAIAQMGQGAGTNTATGASSFANSISNSAQNVGTALAGGTVGASNAISGGLQSAVPWLQAGLNNPSSGGWVPTVGNSAPTADLTNSIVPQF